MRSTSARPALSAVALLAALLPALQAALLATLSTAAPPARAFEFASEPVRAELLADASGLAAGRPLTLAVRLTHAAGWHSYWQVPGDSGLPTRVAWRLPAGFRAGELQWPAPHRLAIGALVDYGYEGETLLLSRIDVPAGLAPGAIERLGARVQWLMCRDVCIPGSAELAIELAVVAPSALRPSEEAAAIERAARLVPQALELAGASASRQGDRIRLAFTAPRPSRTVEFFPLEANRIEASAPAPLSIDGRAVRLDLTVASQGKAESGTLATLRGVLVGDGGPADGGWAGVVELPLK
jgi:DsbC/DsbD-like thiol-disulfide interchange protein